jgi:hypothetical protein
MPAELATSAVTSKESWVGASGLAIAPTQAVPVIRLWHAWFLGTARHGQPNAATATQAAVCSQKSQNRHPFPNCLTCTVSSVAPSGTSSGAPCPCVQPRAACSEGYIPIDISLLIPIDIFLLIIVIQSALHGRHRCTDDSILLPKQNAARRAGAHLDFSSQRLSRFRKRNSLQFQFTEFFVN